MNTFESKYIGRSIHRQQIAVYDYEVCTDKVALSKLISEINCRFYEIVGVTQAADGSYTVFFLRPAQ